MPKVTNYHVQVTLTVTVRTTDAGKVCEHTVVRSAEGPSGSFRPSALTEGAVAGAASAARILSAGVDNAEARRLK